MSKVVLMGATFDTGNRGVSALASSLVKLVLQVRPDADISFFVGSRSSDCQMIHFPSGQIRISFINHCLSPIAGLKTNLIVMFFVACLYRMIPFHAIGKLLIRSNSNLDRLYNSDFIGDIHGGDSFSDIYGLGRFIQGVLPDIIVTLLGKRLVLLPQTYGPYRSFLSQKIARYVFSKAVLIISRDKEGIEMVNKVLGDGNNGTKATYCPDVAFVLDATVPNNITIEPPLARESSSVIIGLNVNGLLYNGGYTRNNMFGLKYDYKVFVQTIVGQLMRDTANHVLLIPHTFGPAGNVNSDPHACYDIISNIEEPYRDRVHMLIGEYNQFEIKGIIGLCDFFIGSRMHACIAAISQEIPTAAVAYSKKFHGVFASLELENMVIDARILDLDKAVNRIIDLFQNRRLEAVPIKRKVDMAIEQVKGKFALLLRQNLDDY